MRYNVVAVDDFDSTVLRPADRKRLTAIVVADGSATTHVLPHSGEVQIGRMGRGGIAIDHSTISRLHAVLRLGELTIEDLGSVNGTYVREALIPSGRRVPFEFGDLIRLGDVFLILTAFEPRR